MGAGIRNDATVKNRKKINRILVPLMFFPLSEVLLDFGFVKQPQIKPCSLLVQQRYRTALLCFVWRRAGSDCSLNRAIRAMQH
jgi:hypothetical protein